MKKGIIVTLITILSLLLVACNGTTSSRKVVLSYAAWGDQSMHQRMIDAFMEEYPDISVSLRTDITGTGNAFTGAIVDSAKVGMLPDVFIIDNVTTAVHEGLAYDATALWDSDQDAQKVYPNIADTAVYAGKRLGIPSFQYLKGVLVNTRKFYDSTQLDTNATNYRLNPDTNAPVFDWTFDEMLEIAKAINVYPESDPTKLLLGINYWEGYPFDFQQVVPSMAADGGAYDTWDGTRFNYSTNELWKDAMRKKVDLENNVYDSGTSGRLNEEDIEQHPFLADQFFIREGYLAMEITGSWTFQTIIEARKQGVNLGFWPYPRVNVGDELFPPTILDYHIISSQTKFPEEAFLLTKWMTFGEDGWNKRVELINEDRVAAELNGEIPALLDRFPIADYDGLWDKIIPLVSDVVGIAEIIERLPYSRPDLDKWLPGYIDLWSWINSEENPNNYSALLAAGSDAVEEFAAVWEAKANEIVSERLENLGNE